MDQMLGMQTSAMSKVFWEDLEVFYATRSSCLTKFLSCLMTKRASTHASSVADQDADLSNCAGFIDCTKTQMARPGGLKEVHIQGIIVSNVSFIRLSQAQRASFSTCSALR